MRKVNDSNDRAKKAQAMLQELAEQVAPSAIVKATTATNPKPSKQKPERYIPQRSTSSLVVVTG